jgi:hypothetical protein
MSRLEVEAIHVQAGPSSAAFLTSDAFEQSLVSQDERKVSTPEVLQPQFGPRRTPRKSLIVVVPDNHVVSPDLVADRLPAEGDNSEEMDVILACAGQPPSLTALQRRVRDLQVLFAPAGTSSEDLRELAMTRAPGDIVTLLSGTPLQA